MTGRAWCSTAPSTPACSSTTAGTRCGARASTRIEARVAVHAFAAKPFSTAADAGVKQATLAEQVGTQALADLQFRRKGLAVATVLILGFLITLGLKIRRLPPYLIA